MTEKDAALERLTNLTFAFLSAKQMGRQFLTAEWVHRNVDGYQDKSPAAFDRAFQRDRLALQKVGVPIEVIAGEVTGYRLQEEDYSLPAVSFTPEEATVLGLAGERGLTGELAVFGRSGWTKIAASGASRSFAGVDRMSTHSDLSNLSASTLDHIVDACNRGRRLTFDYTAHAVAEPVTRTMDPWGLVPLRGRMYLVGFDIDRSDVRVFRITRLSSIKTVGKGSHPRPDVDLQRIVEDTLRRGKELVSAVVQMSPGLVPELEHLGERSGERVTLTDVDKQWLVRTCVGNAPDVLVLSPPDVRDSVIEGLRNVTKK
ncbi:helix-turn-helix transcriptional regulator [Corynebacterium hindlerae]|uniref:helix-turn-helix transcriptional regulator n=1 Tax=Corynebacterium hindlerae TaxID=699041 RepID=UPI003AAE1F53